MNHFARVRFSILTAVIAIPLFAGTSSAQESAGLHACYMPGTGVVYLIRQPGLPDECRASQHVEFYWAEAALGQAPQPIAQPAADPTPGKSGDDHPGRGVPAQSWSLFGNSKSNAAKDKLGTTDFVDLVLVTNNQEGIRLTAEGDVELANNLEVGADLTVKQSAFLNTVGGQTINNGALTVEGATTLNNVLTVEGVTILNSAVAANGQVTIDAALAGGDQQKSAYPLRVQGSDQGIAITVNGTRSNANNFISFFDEAAMQGRIEGQTNEELLLDPEFIYQNAHLILQAAFATLDIVAHAIPEVVVLGIVPIGVTVPLATPIQKTAEEFDALAQITAYDGFKLGQIGVTYSSGAGDFAEWLPKADSAEVLYVGDIVGVRGGVISRDTEQADHLFVISHRPILLGNVPEEGIRDEYEKVAMVGQVPVKVRGVVEVGDYVIPSGRNDGSGIAVKDGDLTADQYSQIVGIAWSSSDPRLSIDYVNVAVGLNSNDVSALVAGLVEEVADLRRQLDDLGKSGVPAVPQIVP